MKVEISTREYTILKGLINKELDIYGKYNNASYNITLKYLITRLKKEHKLKT